MKIHEFLDSPEKWTKGAYARDISGNELDTVSNPNAVCWCAVGLIWKFYPSEACKCFDKLYCVTGERNTTRWSDLSTFEEVREAFRKADL